MRLHIAGAALLALFSPALAHDTPQPPLEGTLCVPYRTAIAEIEAKGGSVLGTLPAPFTRNGTMLYFVTGQVVSAAGLGARNCVVLPAAVVGHLGFDPRTL